MRNRTWPDSRRSVPTFRCSSRATTVSRSCPATPGTWPSVLTSRFKSAAVRSASPRWVPRPPTPVAAVPLAAARPASRFRSTPAPW
ncbi:hypothetical protein ACFFX0_22575 [Citricoccus parietis]|uniref:Uncharacterized protein n=1 Tax=Citricoccus parietis TaxID=592307 RepID=A0ABV5G5B6_9MICC